MGADVEGEIARSDEFAVASPQTPQTPGLAVVDRERAGEAERPDQTAAPALAPFEIGRGH